MFRQLAETGRRSRWHLKKVARAAVALSAGAARRRTDTPQLHVLMYHRFGDAPRDPFSVRLRDFEAQLAWLTQHGLAVSLAQVEGFLAGKRLLPDGAVLVTVDDGFESLYAGALPLLRRYRVPAVAFIPAGLIEPQDDEAAAVRVRGPEPRLTWKQIVELSEAEVAIGSHAWTHRSLGRMSLDEVRTEAVRSRTLLERHTQRAVTAFAYPFGTRADYDVRVAQAVGESGYTCAFTARHGAVCPGLDPFTLPRVKVEGGEPFWMFTLLCRGGLDPWAWVDRNLWWLQASGS